MITESVMLFYEISIVLTLELIRENCGKIILCLNESKEITIEEISSILISGELMINRK